MSNPEWSGRPQIRHYKGYQMNAKLFSISLLAAGVLLASAGQANASGYTFTDLGTLGGKDSFAAGINNAGQVAGMSETVGGAHHATIWNGNTPTDLGTLLGGTNSAALAINNAGQVVGWATVGAAETHATVWTGSTATDLGTLSGITSFALAINDSGQVVGYSDALGNTAVHATIWNGTTPTDLGIQFKGYSYAYGINNSGQVAGYGTFAPYFEPHAIIWNGITPTALGTQVAGVSSFATAINDSGQVAGMSETLGRNGHHATIWNGNIATDLGTLPGGMYSYAAAINNSGQVVGYSWTTDTDSTAYHATIWNGNTLTDLNDLLNVDAVNAGWVLLQATDINDNGWVVGQAHNTITGVAHAFLLTPARESVTFVFDLPSTAETSQTPPYPLVATLTLTEDATGVNFVLTPNWSSPGSDDKSHIMYVDYVYKGLADPVTTYLSGAAIDHFSYHTNQNGMDGSYKTNDQYLEVDFSNNNGEQFDSTHSNSSWSVAGAHLTDFTESFAESKSKPPFIFGLIDVAGYHLPGINPTPSTWVAAVPEPETYAMFMAGLGLIGFIARRRKNSQA